VETPLEPSLLEIRRLPEVLGECGVALDRFQYRVNIAFVIVNSVKKKTIKLLEILFHLFLPDHCSVF